MSWDTTPKVRPRGGARPRAPALRVLFSIDRVVRGVPVVLEPGTTVLGRAVDQGIAIPGDPRVSRRHAHLEVSADGSRAEVVDESSTGTEVDGRRVARAELEEGSLVRVGDTFLLFRRLPEEGTEVEIDGLLGDAPSMCHVKSTLLRAAEPGATVLLLGERGTGKEVAARALHDLSGRGGPFVVVRCGALPGAAADSQLFGHLAGALAGQRSDAPGLFRAAEGGTLFLDEVVELPQQVQPALLRALEERAVVPVGATGAIPCDVRVVASTSRDLAAAVRDGSFRGDLRARLGEVTIEMPPLRERREDVLPILCAHLGTSPPLSPGLAEALLLHRWPLDVRELVRIAARLKVRGRSAERLELDMVRSLLARPASVHPPESEELEPTLELPGEQAPPIAPPGVVPERAALEALLRRHRGVIAEIARETGRSRKQVYRWLAQHGLDAKDFRDAETG